MDKSNSEPLIKEVLINAPLEKIWKIITKKDELKNWYFEFEDFKPEVGFEFKFYGGKDDRQYLHICKITEVIEFKKIKYSWKYDGYAGESFVTFELFNESGKTRVKLTHTGIDTFPSKNPDFAKTNFIEGWNYIIGKLLKEYGENKT